MLLRTESSKKQKLIKSCSNNSLQQKELFSLNQQDWLHIPDLIIQYSAVVIDLA
jgi:hypothetical protein